jgi:hypothetical protein
MHPVGAAMDPNSFAPVEATPQAIPHSDQRLSPSAAMRIRPHDPAYDSDDDFDAALSPAAACSPDGLEMADVELDKSQPPPAVTFRPASAAVMPTGVCAPTHTQAAGPAEPFQPCAFEKPSSACACSRAERDALDHVERSSSPLEPSALAPEQQAEASHIAITSTPAHSEPVAKVQRESKDDTTQMHDCPCALPAKASLQGGDAPATPQAPKLGRRPHGLFPLHVNTPAWIRDGPASGGSGGSNIATQASACKRSCAAPVLCPEGGGSVLARATEPGLLTMPVADGLPPAGRPLQTCTCAAMLASQGLAAVATGANILSEGMPRAERDDKPDALEAATGGSASVDAVHGAEAAAGCSATQDQATAGQAAKCKARAERETARLALFQWDKLLKYEPLGACLPRAMHVLCALHRSSWLQRQPTGRTRRSTVRG